MSARRVPDVTARELVALAAGACLLAVVMHWPLILNLGHDIPNDLGDPLPQAWQMAWGGHALAHQPLHLFQANQFWPFDDTLAFSDALLGYAPAGLIGSGPHAAAVRYDLLFLFSYALAFAGAYLLARELGLGPVGAVIAGAAFAFAPYRLGQDGHMQVISSGGIPLALALGVRGYRLRRSGWIVAAWLVAAWQLSIGFTLGLPFAVLLGAAGVVVAIVWLRRGRPALRRGLAIATVAGAALFVCVGFALSRPYLRVADEHPEARRTPAQVEAYSGPAWIFLIAPEDNPIWGDATSPLRKQLSTGISEKALFPGLVILALAIAGVASSAYPRRLGVGLAIGVAAICVLALGFRPTGAYLWPYRWLYELVPGWQGIRVPPRLMTFSSLGLALLAGAGAERVRGLRLLRGAATWRGGAAVAAVLALAIVVEGRGLPFDPFDDLAQPKVPAVPPSVASVPAPQLHLPANRKTDNRRYLLWSTDGFPALVNGRSSFNPAVTMRLIRRSQGFPSPDTVARLARFGVRSVVLHTNRVKGTPWEDASGRSVAGLPVTRSRRGDLVIYEIRRSP